MTKNKKQLFYELATKTGATADTLNSLSADTLKNLSADTLKNLSADTLKNLEIFRNLSEEQAEKTRLAEIEAEANKGDSQKVIDLKNKLSEIKTSFEFKSAKNKKMYADVNLLIDKIISHIG